MNEPVTFSAGELRHSRPLEPHRRCIGPAGEALVSHVLELVAAQENRTRALRRRDADTRTATVSALLANLACLALNKVDATRFVALSFNGNDYSGQGLYAGSGITLTAMTLARDAMAAAGLIEGRGGVRRTDARATAWGDESRTGAKRHGFNVDQGTFGQLARWRSTPELRQAFRRHGIGHQTIRRGGDVLELRGSGTWVSPEPAEVQDSRGVLTRINHRLSEAVLELPASGWTTIAAMASPADDTGQAAGDLSAVTLRRIFKGSWSRGGRLYGGWWQMVPAALRAGLLIDGQETVELDYQQLHPSMLYARLGRALVDDVYLFPPFPRDLGKLAFNHLLNRRPSAGNALPGRLPPRAPRDLLPKGTSYPQFLELYLDRPSIRPIRADLYQGEGLRLQREDSDIALDVIGQLDAENVLALPIHDSFIVQRQHEATLRQAMQRAFVNRYGVPARVRVS